MTSDRPSRILITGARGKTGRPLLDLLLADPGREVRAGTSDPDHADLPGTPTRFDWSDPDTWEPALDGVDAVFLVRPDRADAPELVGRFAGAAAEAHIVLLSEQGAELLGPDAWAPRVEAALRAATEDWTMLRPSWFHQVITDPRFHLDDVRRRSVVPISTGGGAIAFIDAEDIAASAAAVLADPTPHRGRAYTLTGPHALTIREVANVLSERLGRPIMGADPEPGEGIDDAFDRAIVVELAERIRRGDFAAVTDAVRELTGRAPRSLADFADRHRAELAKARG